MSWHSGRLAAFDIETTGIDHETDRIVTAAVSVVGNGLPPESHNWLVNPGIEIPEAASDVHGITTERARAEGCDPAEAVEAITSELAAQILAGTPIIAFNARFDLSFLDREARRYEVEPLVDRVGGAEHLLVVDPLIIDKQLDRFRRGKRTLGAVCAHYGVALDDAHAADADAIAAARVAWRLAKTFGEVGGADLPTLHQLQIGWAAEQAASLEQYFREQGKDQPVEPAWPLVPFTATVA
ncbi:MAG: exonuclease domain-containing protein [Solirubrobacterales bacterium]